MTAPDTLRAWVTDQRERRRRLTVALGARAEQALGVDAEVEVLDQLAGVGVPDGTRSTAAWLDWQRARTAREEFAAAAELRRGLYDTLDRSKDGGSIDG